MLEILNICKEVEGQTILKDINLRIESGEFFSLLGPSGCGKTTLLRILSGLDTPTSGEIRIDGQRVDQLPPQKRPFNMVFQKYALFPHLSVRDNVAFGLKIQNLAAQELQERVDKVLEMTGLKGFADRRPETLSGGQAQRVAVARALVNQPKVLLLDEPLSALDQKMREHMKTELRTLQKKLGLTFIFVTHDQDEALTLSDRIGVMNHGRLEQVSAPRALYDRPETSFAAQFVGQSSRLSGHFVESTDGVAKIRLSDNSVIAGRLTQPLVSLREGTRMQVFIRPERIQVVCGQGATSGAGNRLNGSLSHSVFRGDQTELMVDCLALGSMKAVLSGNVDCASFAGPVQLCFSTEDTVLFGSDE